MQVTHQRSSYAGGFAANPRSYVVSPVTRGLPCVRACACMGAGACMGACVRLCVCGDSCRNQRNHVTTGLSGVTVGVTSGCARNRVRPSAWALAAFARPRRARSSSLPNFCREREEGNRRPLRLSTRLDATAPHTARRSQRLSRCGAPCGASRETGRPPTTYPHPPMGPSGGRASTGSSILVLAPVAGFLDCLTFTLTQLSPCQSMAYLAY
jgi:hypothetical protein